jgi:hypothetical protein
VKLPRWAQTHPQAASSRMTVSFGGDLAGRRTPHVQIHAHVTRHFLPRGSRATRLGCGAR